VSKVKRGWIVGAAVAAVVVLIVLNTRIVEEVPPPDEYAQRLVAALNEQRVEAGMAPLEWSQCLSDAGAEVAPVYAQSLRADASIESVPCEGAEDFAELPLRGNKSPEYVVDTWLSSSYRRDIVMDPADRAIGVGCVRAEVDIRRLITCSVLFAPDAPDLPGS
jgi:uncharacterized protein YkwD